jgi:hypothetical protein
MKRPTLEIGFCLAVGVAVFLFLVVKTGLWKRDESRPLSEPSQTIKVPVIEPQKRIQPSWNELSEVKATNSARCGEEGK